MLNGKLWVVAPHPDDEILGCYNIIRRFKGDIHISYISTGKPGEAWEDYEGDKAFEMEDRLSTNMDRDISVSTPLNWCPDSMLNTCSESQMVSALSFQSKCIRPTVVAIPSFGDRNLDHKITSNAVMSAIRQGKCPTVNTILGYWTLSSSMWPDGKVSNFTPNICTTMSDADINHKVQVMSKIYPEKMGGPHINREAIGMTSRYWAYMMACGSHYCEPYELIYHVERRQL